MDAIQLRLNPTHVPHVYTILTIDGLAKRHSIASVPYLKAILEVMSANAKMVRRDNVRAAYASACRSISAAILAYLADAEKSSPNSTVTKGEFYTDVDALHEHILSQWISSR